MNVKKPEFEAEKKKSILDAAQNRFSSYGYSKVTMDEIAEDIGMAKASLYYYFPTKDDILRGVIQREREEYVQSMQNVLKNPGSATERFLAYFQLRIKFSGQIFNLSYHNHQIWPSMKPIFKDLFLSLSMEEETAIAQLLRDGITKKEFTLESPEQTAELIQHVIQGLRIRLFHLDHNGASMETIHQNLVNDTQLFINILLSGIQTRPEK
jgi:TetR/AcrR family transcriptional repressor of mexJK operon